MPHAAYIAVPLIATAAIAAFIIRDRLPSKAQANAEAPPQGGTYLFPNKLPDGLAILTPPPAQGSIEMKRDLDARQSALKLRDTPRYVLATSDSERNQLSTVQAFTCALGTDISPERTPGLYRMLEAMRVDVRASSYSAKARFKRPQPFEVYHSNTCSSADEQLVKGAGNYPDARAAVGWAYALVLSEIEPARTDAIMQRGREFGQSRMICDAAWQSDVDAGISLATQDVIRLRQDKKFLADLNSAKAEVAAALRAGVKPPHDCGVESTALAMR